MSKPKNRIGLVPIIFGLAVVAAMWLLAGRGGPVNNLTGAAPPSLDAGGTWLNTDRDLSWQSLAGNVVWLEFSFLH